MKRLALMFLLGAAVFAGGMSAASTAEAGPFRYRPYRVYRPYVYRPYVVRPRIYPPPYRAFYGPPVVGYGYYGYPGWYGPGVSVGVGWY